MGQAVTRLLFDDTDQTRSSRNRKLASNGKASAKYPTRIKAPKSKAKSTRTHTVSTKARSSSSQKPKQRRVAGHPVRSKYASNHRAYSDGRQSSASVGGLHSSYVSSKSAPRLKRRDLDILASERNRNRLPERPKRQTKRVTTTPASRSKPPKKTAKSRTNTSSSRNVQDQVDHLAYGDGEYELDGYPRRDHAAILRIDCVVCAESKTARHFPTQPPTASCTHDAQTCTRCLRQWIQSEFESKVWDQIDCPECRERMQFEDVRQFAPSAIFRKYESLATKAAFEAIPGFRWCTGKGCTSGQVHDSGYDSPKFDCIACHRRYCVVHNRRWHEGETCQEYDYRTDGTQRRAEEKASEKLIKETAKKCPGCKGNVEKMSGCDHMTCSKCRHQYCWICLAPYGPIRKDGNSKHRKTCTYYSV